MSRALILVVFAILVIFAVGPFSDRLAAQDPTASCALDLEARRGTDAAYQPREQGRRCEGVFVQPSAASTQLTLRGFHLGAPSFHADSAQNLTIEVVGANRPPGGTLVARSLRPRHFYQMDTRALDEDGRFVWSTDILRHPDVNMTPGELAVLYRRGGEEGSQVHVLPVRVTGTGGQPGPPIPLIFLEPETTIESVILRVERLESGEVVHQRTMNRHFAPGMPIRIPLPRDPGTFRILVTGVGPDTARAVTMFTAEVPPEAADPGP